MRFEHSHPLPVSQFASTTIKHHCLPHLFHKTSCLAWSGSRLCLLPPQTQRRCGRSSSAWLARQTASIALQGGISPHA